MPRTKNLDFDSDDDVPSDVEGARAVDDDDGTGNISRGG